ncbi:hypothetical protein ONS96_001146 [Cadophora gregata f. sp. sojae]|nr:hypothetical protein ONS96_001146 [Cadophora gregata f. sp. sojae]
MIVPKARFALWARVSGLYLLRRSIPMSMSALSLATVQRVRFAHLANAFARCLPRMSLPAIVNAVQPPHVPQAWSVITSTAAANSHYLLEGQGPVRLNAVTAIKIADHHSVAKEASVVSLGLQQVADLDETRGRRDSE